jgi:hypothetical protein
MLAVPLLLVYTLGFTIIKYEEGTVFIEGYGGALCVLGMRAAD